MNIYLSTLGKDTQSGLTASTPVRSLAKALALAKARRLIEDVPVQVFFLKGSFYGQQITWNSYSSRYQTVFAPLAGLKTGDVIFDGRTLPTDKRGSLTYFMKFVPPSGLRTSQITNILMRNLVVRNYLEGITFSGATRDNPSVALRRSKITECVFRQMGNLYATAEDPNTLGMAVIRTVNSRENQFIGNQFVDISNTLYTDGVASGKPYGAALHSIYLAHHSSLNRIEGNTFENHKSGSAIKIRDSSDDNLILRNRFTDVLPNTIEQWHCEYNERRNRDQNPETGCTKAEPDENYECLSYRTQEFQNIYGSKSPFDIFTFESYACSPPTLADQFRKERATPRTTGFIQKTLLNGVAYYGLCGNSLGCVNSAGTCYASNTGTSHLWCFQNQWSNCNASSVGTKSGTRTCTAVPASNPSDYQWK